jgi:hypothetical protein
MVPDIGEQPDTDHENAMKDLIVEGVSLYHNQIKETLKHEYLYYYVCKKLGPNIDAANFWTLKKMCNLDLMLFNECRIKTNYEKYNNDGKFIIIKRIMEKLKN